MARLIYPPLDFSTNTKLARAFSRNAECRMFDWNDLKYFLAVARAGTTLKAAAALKVKARQPGASPRSKKRSG